MKKRGKIIATFGLITMIALVTGCLDPFSPPETESQGEYLVVNAFLNSEEGSCYVKLTYTVPLDSDDPVVREIGAGVQIESETGETYPVPEVMSGEYSASMLPIDNTKKYRLRIVTLYGKQVVSEFVPIRNTPEIDSISWKINEDGKDLTIYANTHDPSNETRYYQWQYTETWLYHSAYNATVKWESGVVSPRTPSEAIYECWQNEVSSKLLTGSSAKLQNDVMQEFKLTSEALNSEKMALRYSILVKQFAITKEAYEYWETLRKNTENLGTLFDPLPSEVSGNFSCVSNPNEPVIGFFQAGSMKTKRLFIAKRDLPPVRSITQYDGCRYDTILLQNLPNFQGNGMLIGGVGVSLIGYSHSSSFCVDCRLAGGTTTKPDFW